MMSIKAFEFFLYSLNDRLFGVLVNTHKHENLSSDSCCQQVPLTDKWDDIRKGIKVEIVNNKATLHSKVYWIATVLKLAGKTVMLPTGHWH